MNLVQPGLEPIKFVSSDSDSSQDKDLLSVVYTRVQKESPEFMTVHDSIDQSVDIKISTFIFRAAPEPVLSLYDFIITTFVPESGSTVNDRAVARVDEAGQIQANTSSEGRIRVSLKLASVQGQLLPRISEFSLMLLQSPSSMSWRALLRSHFPRPISLCFCDLKLSRSLVD